LACVWSGLGVDAGVDCPLELKAITTSATLTKVTQLPLGHQAAELLDQIKRAQALFKEIESYYKRLLEETPGAIPGWMLQPGDVRRSIEDTVALRERLVDLFSVEELLGCCSPSVPALERMWARKKGVPVNGAKAGFKQFLGPLLVEKRAAPSLQRVSQ
jgi:hypothetical protein